MNIEMTTRLNTKLLKSLDLVRKEKTVAMKTAKVLGRLLVKLRPTFPHRTWLPYLASVGLTKQQASLYMKIYKDWKKIVSYELTDCSIFYVFTAIKSIERKAELEKAALSAAVLDAVRLLKEREEEPKDSEEKDCSEAGRTFWKNRFDQKELECDRLLTRCKRLELENAELQGQLKLQMQLI
jgi:hypothetical protein